MVPPGETVIQSSRLVPRYGHKLPPDYRCGAASLPEGSVSSPENGKYAFLPLLMLTEYRHLWNSEDRCRHNLNQRSQPSIPFLIANDGIMKALKGKCSAGIVLTYPSSSHYYPRPVSLACLFMSLRVLWRPFAFMHLPSSCPHHPEEI